MQRLDFTRNDCTSVAVKMDDATSRRLRAHARERARTHQQDFNSVEKAKQMAHRQSRGHKFDARVLILSHFSRAQVSAAILRLHDS